MSINARIRVYLLVIVLFLVVVSVICEFHIDNQSDLVVWGVHIPNIYIAIVTATSKFILGVVTTLILSFITPRIDCSCLPYSQKGRVRNGGKTVRKGRNSAGEDTPFWQEKGGFR